MKNRSEYGSFKRKEYAFQLVGLGGTFDHLHQGHKTLLKHAFMLGKHVAIALATDELLENKEFAQKIQSYEKRLYILQKFIDDDLDIPKDDYTIIPLSDPFGPAITDKFLEAHVSSMETYKVSLLINQKRIENNLKPLVLMIIPMVLDKQGERYSSTKIRKEI